MGLIEQARVVIDEVRREYVPDARVAVFEILVGVEEEGLILVGATSEPAAVEELRLRLASLEAGVAVVDEVARLPDPDGDGRDHALVTASVAPMLAGPSVSEPHLSQALLGHRLHVLRQHGRWLHCRAEDGYLGWIHRGYLSRVDERDARGWTLGAGGVPCLSLGADLLDERGEVLARLPWGARLVLDEEGAGRLPTGATGRLDGEVLPLPERPERFPTDGEALVRTASRWMGAPYLWGGTTPSGVDCSGLAQALYRTHGVDLPRDSDQQARQGVEVDPGPDFSRLRPGDLLFFAEDPGRVTHVTISEGGARIVHSSLGNGGVRRNDLAGDHPYEEELRRIFVTARRIIP